MPAGQQPLPVYLCVSFKHTKEIFVNICLSVLVPYVFFGQCTLFDMCMECSHQNLIKAGGLRHVDYLPALDKPHCLSHRTVSESPGQCPRVRLARVPAFKCPGKAQSKLLYDFHFLPILSEIIFVSLIPMFTRSIIYI